MKSKGNGDLSNKLKLDCVFKKYLKDLTLDFILVGYNRQDIQDVRRFKVFLPTIPKPLIKDITMKTCTRQTTALTVPI